MTSQPPSLRVTPETTIPRKDVIAFQEQSIATSKALGSQWFLQPPNTCVQNAIPLYAALPPYDWPERLRIAEYLGLVDKSVQRFLESDGIFCNTCNFLGFKKDIQISLQSLDAKNFCITGEATLETVMQQGLSRLVMNDSAIDMEESHETLEPDSQVEAVIERFKRDKPHSLDRSRRALHSAAQLGFRKLALRSWPLSNQRIFIKSSTHCPSCSVKLAQKEEKSALLGARIWMLDIENVEILKALKRPLESFADPRQKLWSDLKLTHLRLDTFIKDLPLADQHKLAVSKCIRKKIRYQAVISPVDFGLSTEEKEALKISLSQHCSPQAQITLGAIQRKSPPPAKDSIKEISPHSCHYLRLPDSSRASIEELIKQIEQICPPDYKLKSFYPESASRSNAYATVASHADVFTALRKLYAKHPHAKIEGLTPKSFGLGPGSLRCTACAGRGEACPVCKNSRYQPLAHSIKFNRISLPKLLMLPVAEAFEIMKRIPDVAKPLEHLINLELGHLVLNTPLAYLNCGDLQTLRIFKLLQSASKNSVLLLTGTNYLLTPGQQQYFEKISEELLEKGTCIIHAD